MPVVNELGHFVRRLIFSVDPASALDAVVVLRVVSTVADAGKAGRCCRNDSLSSRCRGPITRKDRVSMGNRGAKKCGLNCRQIDNLRRFVRSVPLLANAY